jgi:hypothetical protein
VTGSGNAPDEGGGGGGGELTLSGGGSTLVATDTVFAEMAALRGVQREAEGWDERLGEVQALGVGNAMAWQPGDLGVCLLGAQMAIREIADETRQLADSLVEAAEQYGRSEDGLDMLLRNSAAWLGHTAGQLSVFAPFLALSLAVPLAATAGVTMGWNTLLGRGPSLVPPWLADWLRQNPRLLSDPATVRLVRVLVSSADDAVLGRLGVPFPLATALGEDGAGLLGASSSALGLVAAARAAGMLRETPVRVDRVGSSPGAAAALTRPGVPAVGAIGRPGPLAVPLRGSATTGAGATRAGATRADATRADATRADATTGADATGAGATGGEATADSVLAAPTPPAGFADLAVRIPTPEDGGQVRIERYGDAEHPRWVVYIGGTVDWNLADSGEPWDMTSNVTAVADQEAGSYRAVVQALQAAGMAPGDPVVPVAHSQGGLLANQLVSRGDINAVGLVTFGAPETGLPLPNGLPAIAIEHDDDIVPALGQTAGDDPRLYVRTELFAGRPVPADAVLPAHQLDGYRETAGLLDSSAEPRLVDFRSTLGAFVGTLPGQQSVWHADRVG